MDYADTQEYLTGNEAIAYPFKEDAEGLSAVGAPYVHGAEALLPRDFMLDIVITIPGQDRAQLYLQSICRSGSIYTFTFCNDTGPVFAGTLTAIPAERSMVAFQTPLSRIMARLVTGPSFAAFLDDTVDGTTDVFHLNLPLETAVVEFTPLKLTDLLVHAMDMNGDVRLYEGYNVQLDIVPADPATDTPATLKITAGSGLGAGQYNPCPALNDGDDGCGNTVPAVDYIGTINGQPGNASDGSFTLDNDPCYRIIPDAAGNRLQVTNDCLPCCTCDQYAAMVVRLQTMFARLALARTSLNTTVTNINSDAAWWNGTLSVPLAVPQVESIYVALGNAAGVFVSGDVRTASGKSPNYASLIVMVRNPGNLAVAGLSLEITGIAAPLEVMQTTVFYYNSLTHTDNQYFDGVATTFPSFDMAAGGTYFKPVLLLRNTSYPSQVTGTFTANLKQNGVLISTKSITL